MNILPLFTSAYSMPQQGSLLLLDEPGKEKPGAPVSIFTLAQQAGLKDVVVVDDRIDGAMAALKSAAKAKVKLCYGIKLVVCADGDDHSEASLRTESKVIIFAREGTPNERGVPKGYSDLVSIWSRATIRGSYYVPRTSWAWLKEQWTPNLTLALPFFSSFIARNTLTFNKIVPDLPTTPWVFRETDSRLPFAPLIDTAIDRYLKDCPAQVARTKSIYYAKPEDMEAYMVMRALGERRTFDTPNVDHMSSDQFSFAAWRALALDTAL